MDETSYFFKVYDFRGPPRSVDEVHKILLAMGATETEKAELSSYQLKDVAQTWCKMWQDRRALIRVPVSSRMLHRLGARCGRIDEL